MCCVIIPTKKIHESTSYIFNADQIIYLNDFKLENRLIYYEFGFWCWNSSKIWIKYSIEGLFNFRQNCYFWVKFFVTVTFYEIVDCIRTRSKMWMSARDEICVSCYQNSNWIMTDCDLVGTLPRIASGACSYSTPYACVRLSLSHSSVSKFIETLKHTNEYLSIGKVGAHFLVLGLCLCFENALPSVECVSFVRSFVDVCSFFLSNL